MSRIEKTFQSLKDQDRTALVTYIAAGDPDIQTAQSILDNLSKAGADIIELGMPFTDPMADGPTIQAATQRALESGTTLIKTLQMVKDFRASNDNTPLVLMGYFNPIYQYGCEKFISDAKAAGVDGLIIVDLPPEEDEELSIHAKSADIDLIRLVTPVTEDDRLETVIGNASGFLYYVSITGVTGTASADTAVVNKHIAHIKTKTALPVAVGFGIKTPDDAKAFADTADAILVGSALVSEIETNPSTAEKEILQKVTSLKQAI